MNIVTTSKGPANIDHYTRSAEKTDNGHTVGISFFFSDGGTMTLPLPEGDRLRSWLEARSLFDSRAEVIGARHA